MQLMITINWVQNRGDWHGYIQEINLLYVKKNSSQKLMCQILKFLFVLVQGTLLFLKAKDTLEVFARENVIQISVAVKEGRNFAIPNAIVVYHV